MAALPTAQIGDLYHANSQKMLNEVFGPNLDNLFHNKATPDEVAAKIQADATALL